MVVVKVIYLRSLTIEAETHKVDFSKGRVAIEIERKNQNPFYSPDLNTLRRLHELNLISVGVIITRMDELQDILDELPPVWSQSKRKWEGIGKKYAPSTTRWSKLLPRVEAGGAGKCPLLILGITVRCYRDDISRT